MQGVIVEGKSADHKVRVTKTCRPRTHNTRHIWKTPIMRQHYVRKQMVKCTGCLEDIITETNSIKHFGCLTHLQQPHK